MSHRRCKVACRIPPVPGEALEYRQVIAVPIPLDQAEDTRLIAFRPVDGGAESLALIVGAPDLSGQVPVIIHRQNSIADLVGSLGPHLGPLRDAVARLMGAGGGVLLYLPVAPDDVMVTASAILKLLDIADARIAADAGTHMYGDVA